MVEVDRPKFRQGETPTRPIGGNIADTPFAIALRNVMIEAGFDSQLSLSRALNKKSNRNVSNWLTDKKSPSPEEVGGLLIVFDENDVKAGNKKLEVFLNEYGRELAKRELKNTVNRFERRKSRKSFNTPVSKWIENFCETRGSSLGDFFEEIGFKNISVSGRRKFSFPVLVDIERGVQSRYGKNSGDSFREAMNREIRERQRMHKKVKTSTTRGMTEKQRESNEPLYNGQQAADRLGTTRETVRMHRKKLGWELLLTESQVEQLRNIVEENRKIKGHKAEEREKVFKKVQIYPLAS